MNSIQEIQVDWKNLKLTFPNINKLKSPASKLQKVTTPSKVHDACSSVIGSTSTEDIDFEDISASSDLCENACKEDLDVASGICIDITEDTPTEIKCVLKEMAELLPSVVNVLKQNGNLDIWLLMMRQCSIGIFPDKSIAFQLFADVVKFVDCRNIHAMRYPDSSIRFWALGYQLFKSRKSSQIC